MRVLQQPEKAFYDSIIDEIWQMKDSSLNNLKVTPKLESFEITKTHNGVKFDFSAAESGLYFVLKSDKNSYLYPSHIKPLGMKAYLERDFILNNQLKIDNFTAEISKLYIQSGKYRIGIISVENNAKKIYWSTEILDIQAIEKTKPKQNW